MRPLAFTGLALAVILASLSLAHADYRCDRPPKPNCITVMIGGNRADFDFCRMEMMTFQRKVSEFVACLHRQQEDAIGELNQAISDFNACASGATC